METKTKPPHVTNISLSFVFPGNYYGTPKPPAEPSPVQPDLVDQVLFDEEFDTEVQRKRTTSVSKMDRKDSAAPEEEEEEERPPMANGLPGERERASSPPQLIVMQLLLFPAVCVSLLHLFICLCGSLHQNANVSVPPDRSFLQTVSGLTALRARSALNHTQSQEVAKVHQRSIGAVLSLKTHRRCPCANKARTML